MSFVDILSLRRFGAQINVLWTCEIGSCSGRMILLKSRHLDPTTQRQSDSRLSADYTAEHWAIQVSLCQQISLWMEGTLFWKLVQDVLQQPTYQRTTVDCTVAKVTKHQFGVKRQNEKSSWSSWSVLNDLQGKGWKDQGAGAGRSARSKLCSCICQSPIKLISWNGGLMWFDFVLLGWRCWSNAFSKSAHTALAVKACLLGGNSNTKCSMIFVNIAVAISALAGGAPKTVSHRDQNTVVFSTFFEDFWVSERKRVLKWNFGSFW